MSWENWLEQKRFTLYRSSIIQKPFIDLILNEVLPKSKILEAGTGSGVTLALLDDLEYNVYGFDNFEILY